MKLMKWLGFTSVVLMLSLNVAGQSCVKDYEGSTDEAKIADVSKCPDLLNDAKIAEVFFSGKKSGDNIRDYPEYAKNFFSEKANGATVDFALGDVKYDGKNLYSGSTKITLTDYGSEYDIKSLDVGGFSITYQGKTTTFNGDNIQLETRNGVISVLNAERKTIKVNGIDTRISGNVEFEGDKIIVHKGSSYERIEGSDFIKISAKTDMVVNGDDLKKLSWKLDSEGNLIWNIDVASASKAEWIIETGKIVDGKESNILKVGRLLNKEGNLVLVYHVDNALVPKEGVDFGLDVLVDNKLRMGITPEKISKGQLFSAVHDIKGKIVLKLVPEKGVLKAMDKNGKTLYYTLAPNSDGTFSYVTSDGRKSQPYTKSEIVDIMTRNFGSNGIDAFEEALVLLTAGKNAEKVIKTLLPKSPDDVKIGKASDVVDPKGNPKFSDRGLGHYPHPIYGVKKFHSGQDIPADYGAKIMAVAHGTVKFAGQIPGYGNVVIIDHGNKLETWYAHASGFNVKNGQTVVMGQTIAFVGSTGDSTGPHLHYEVRKDGKPVNPRKF